jgi:tol-pal system protein YbgF
MRWLIVPAFSMAALGCVSSGDIDLLHREITDVSRQVENLNSKTPNKDELQGVTKRVADQSASVLKSNADIQVELKQLREQIQALQANLESTNQRLAALSNELAATRDRFSAGGPPPAVGASAASGAPAPTGPGVAGPAGAPGAAAAGTAAAAGRSVEPAQLYNTAYEDYLRGNFDLAIQGFQEYAKRFPTTDLADNALYWIGECYYSKKAYKEAIDSFTQLLNTYKTSDKAAAALLKKGLAYLELGDRSQAVINLQYVLYEHPGSKEADLARSKLASLGVKVK